MGVWIEICIGNGNLFVDCVTPLVGVWIEIAEESECSKTKSHVTPLVGVWIEIIQRAP